MTRPIDQASLWTHSSAPGCEWFKATYRDHRFTPHVHPTYAIGAICCGAERFHCLGANRIASAGSIVAIHPNEVHDGERYGADPYTYRLIYVEPTWFEDIFGAGRAPHFRNPVVQDRELAQRLWRAHRLSELPPEAGGSQCAAMLREFLRDFAIRYGNESSATQPAVGSRRIADAKQWLDAHLADHVRLDDVAAAVGVSAFHFHRQFRRAVGMTPHAWLNVRRVERAAQLLRARMPAAEVALAVGFCDQSHLITMFKRIRGVTPGSFARGVAG